MENQYEYDGQMIIVRSPTVGSAYAERTIILKLRDVLVAEEGGALSDDLITPVYEYAAIVSRTCAEGAPWWRRAADTPASLLEGFQAFMNMEVEFVQIAREQSKAVEPEKKMTGSTSKK